MDGYWKIFRNKCAYNLDLDEVKTPGFGSIVTDCRVSPYQIAIYVIIIKTTNLVSILGMGY